MTLSNATYNPQIVSTNGASLVFFSVADGGPRVGILGPTQSSFGTRGESIELHRVPGVTYVGSIRGGVVVEFRYQIETRDQSKIASRMIALHNLIPTSGGSVTFYLHRDGTDDNVVFWPGCRMSISGAGWPGRHEASLSEGTIRLECPSTIPTVIESGVVVSQPEAITTVYGNLIVSNLYISGTDGQTYLATSRDPLLNVEIADGGTVDTTVPLASMPLPSVGGWRGGGVDMRASDNLNVILAPGERFWVHNGGAFAMMVFEIISSALYWKLVDGSQIRHDVPYGEMRNVDAL